LAPKLFILAAGALTAGLLAHYFLNWTLGAGLLIFVCAGGLALLLKGRPTLWLPIFILTFFGLGLIRANQVDQPSRLDASAGHKITLTGQIVAEPDEREVSQRLVFQPDDLAEGVLVVSGLYPAYFYGERLELTGKLEPPENFAGSGGREFDYVNYLAKDNIHYQIYQPEIKVVEEGGRSFFGFLYQIKNYFLDRLNQLIPEPAAALLGGLLVGAKRSLGAEWLEIFRRAGVIHIVVLSGYNLTIIAAAVLALGRRLPKRLAILLAGFIIILFTLMTGAGAASVRAAIMAVIALYALAAGRSYEVGWALFLSFTLMLIYNPRLLLYDPGFQLSFLATAGLVYFSPLVAPWFKRWPARFGFREIVTSTLATQAFVLPWLIYQTGQLSLVSLLSNLLVLPVIPLTMLTGFLAGSLALLSPLLATPLVYLAYLPLSYILKTTQFLAGLPLAVVTINFFPAWLILLIYLGFSFWLGRFYARASSNAQT
jgi:competence protein ComEC